MDFEFIKEIKVDSAGDIYNPIYHKFLIFREKTTDVLWIKHKDVFKEMLDPSTGLPLTYKSWSEHYNPEEINESEEEDNLP